MYPQDDTDYQCDICTGQAQNCHTQKFNVYDYRNSLNNIPEIMNIIEVKEEISSLKKITKVQATNTSEGKIIHRGRTKLT